MGRRGTYKGEYVPGKGAHGHGIFSCPDNTVEGLYYNGKANGLCYKYQPSGSIAIGEQNESQWDGHYTFYNHSGNINNKEYVKGQAMGIVTMEGVFFGKGTPNNK